MCLSDQGKHKFEGDKLIFSIFLPLMASFNSNLLSMGGNFDKDPCNMNGKGWNGMEKIVEKEREGKRELISL